MRLRHGRRTAAVVAILALAVGWFPIVALASQSTPAPAGADLTRDELAALVAQFDDEVLIGGQVAPRFARWVNDEVFIFLQLDSSDLAEATEVRYIGIGVKGVFCAETQPDPSFTHFHKYEAPEYAEGHGSEPGDQGYWLTWASVAEIETRDGCQDEIRELAALFDGEILTGGQTPPRFHKWVNEDVTIFLQFDSSNLDEATTLRDVGITVPGEFCAENQPSADFPHFHQTNAPEYAEGHGSAPHQVGYWLLWVATDTYETRDGRQVTPGVDREFSPTPPPTCGDAAGTPAAAVAPEQVILVSGTEYAFAPAELRAGAGELVSVTFQNDGTVPHTFTLPAADVDTGSVAAGAGKMVTFTAPTEPGAYEFLCSFGGHPEAGMVGSLIVEA